MPTAVLDLDLTNLPETITVPQHYTHAFMLIRYNGTPVGKLTTSITKGQLKTQHIHPQLLQAAEPALKQTWLHHRLQWDETAVTDTTQFKATIAICTRNRTDDLKRCLDALMQLPNDGQEILVIDNCPSNNATEKLVETYPSVKYVLEPKPGLDFARNTALKEASGDIIAFTDDDAVPDPNWLRALLKNFNDEQVMCVTGMTMPLELETEAQEAFERYSPFGKGFKRKVYSVATHHPLNTGQVGAGANMAFRKTVVKEIGWFDEALDAGTPTESGGDHEFFARILLSGYHIVYEPEALSWHRHRRTWKETTKAIRGYGIGVYAFWTRLLFVEKQPGILRFPYSWFMHEQLPGALRSLFRRPGSQPLQLVLAELRGCALGPWKYYLSRQRLKRLKRIHNA